MQIKELDVINEEETTRLVHVIKFKVKTWIHIEDF